MAYKIGVIFNPKARKNTREPKRKERLENIVGDQGIVRETYTAEHVKEVMQEFIDHKVKHVVFVGGDGTTQTGLTKFINEYKKTINSEAITDESMIVLPYVLPGKAGTINFSARVSNVNGTIEENLQKLVETCKNEAKFKTFQLQTMKITTYPKDEPENIKSCEYGFVFGNGTVTNFLEKYYSEESVKNIRKFTKIISKIEKKVEDKLLGTNFVSEFIDDAVAQTFYEMDRPSAIKAFRLIAKGIFSIIVGADYHKKVVEPTRAKVYIDGKELPYGEYNVLAASSIKANIIGFTPFYRIEEENKKGEIHAYAGNVPALNLVWNFFKTTSSRPQLKIKNGYDGLAKEIIIAQEKKEGEELKYTLDAEIKKADEIIKITPGPKVHVPQIYW